jgi:hypothetical protein
MKNFTAGRETRTLRPLVFAVQKLAYARDALAIARCAIDQCPKLRPGPAFSHVRIKIDKPNLAKKSSVGALISHATPNQDTSEGLLRHLPAD